VCRSLAVLLLLALTAPLVIANGFVLPFVVPKAFFLQGMVALALTLLAVEIVLDGKGLRALRRLDRREAPILWAFLAFVLAAAVSGIMGLSPARSLLGTLERRWGALTWASFLGFYLLLRVHLNGQGWKRALQVAVAVATAVSLYGLLRASGLWPGQAEPIGWSRMSSTLGNPGYLAAYLALGASLTGYLTLRASRGWHRWICAAALAVQVTALLLSGTRAVVLGAGVAALVVATTGFLLTSDPRLRWAAAGGIVVLTAAGGALFLTTASGDPHVLSWWDRLVSVLSPETSSARLRLVVWSATLEGIREAPLIGAGPENFDLVWSRTFEPLIYNVAGSTVFDRAHNVVVGTAATTGLLGLTAYLAMWGAVGWGIIRAWRRGALSALGASILAFGAITYFVYLLFWFEDHSSFLAFIVLAGLVGHLASSGDPPGGATARTEDGHRQLDASSSEGEGARDENASPTGTGPGGSAVAVRFGVPALLFALATILVWHNVRTFNAARNTWDGEYSYEAWDGVENFRAALAPGLPGSESILGAYLRRLTFLAGHGDSGGPEGPTPRMERALAVADSALTGWAARDPHNPWVHIQRSRFCGILQDVRGGTEGKECAAESLRRAIELSPRQIRFRHWLANHHLAAGEPDRALEVLDEALRVYDSFGETYHYVARVHRRTGDMDEAVRQARIAISLGYAGQPAPFVLELSDWLAGEGRHGEAADLLESHLALRFRKLARPELETPAGRGFQPWDLPLASRLPLLHWRADRPEEAIRTARFLAHRLGPPEGEREERRDARLRRFVRDVEAGRRDRWEGVRSVLDERSEADATTDGPNVPTDDGAPAVPTGGGAGADEGLGPDDSGVTPPPDRVRDESVQGGDSETGTSWAGDDARPRLRGLHAPGADGGARGPGARGGDRAPGPAPAPRHDRPGAGRVGLPGETGPGPDAGHRPARGGAHPDHGGRRADAGGPGGQHREPDTAAGRAVPGGLGPAPACHAALQQPGPGGAGKPLSVPRQEGGADRQQLPGAAPDRAIPVSVSRSGAALISTGMHPLRQMRRPVKG
jgi:O-antigen ligase/tetratricopeptide (TPR) repeat protein